MSKYKVGDKFIINIKEVLESEKGTLYRANYNTLVFDDYGLDGLQKYDALQDRLELIEELKKAEYNKGLTDAWELAKKILYGIDKQIMEIFDVKVEPRFFDLTDKREIINNHTPQGAKAKIEEWRELKQIEVGDVVEITHYDEKFKGLVLDILDEISFVLLTENGTVESYVDERVKKTGKHIDIKNIFEQIGE